MDILMYPVLFAPLPNSCAIPAALTLVKSPNFVISPQLMLQAIPSRRIEPSKVSNCRSDRETFTNQKNTGNLWLLGFN